MTKISMTVNGKPISAEVDPRTLLVDFVRENLALTGTHTGCNTTHCGACTVHVDGNAVKSCTMLAVECDETAVTTIEGISADGSHPMQKAFREHHGLQCGYCTSGMIMVGIDIANRLGEPDRDAIRSDLKGNICRCTGYHNIVTAIEAGAAACAVASTDKDAGGNDA